MNIRPIFWLWLCCSLAQVQAATLPDKVEQTLNAPEDHFDTAPNIDLSKQPAPDSNTQNSSSLSLSSQELQKQPALLKHAFFSAVASNNVAAVRLLLPLYRQLPDGNDTLSLTLAEAILARADGNYDQAIEQFQTALKMQPNMPVAQMSLAQTLYADYRQISAEQAFTQIQQQNELPDDFRQLAQTYLNTLKAREDWQFQFNANYAHDKNVANTPDEQTIGFWKLNAPQSAHGIAYYAHAGREKYLADHLTLRLSGDVYGKFYWDNHGYDDLAARVKAGIGYQTSRSETSVQPYFERRWFGGEGYSRELGIAVDWSYWLTPRNQILLSAEHGNQDYDERKFLTGNNKNLSLTWLFVPNAKQYWVLGADWSRKYAQDSSDAYRRQAIRIGWTQQWPAQFGTSLMLSWAKRTYDAPNFPFNYIREDKEYFAMASLWNQKIQWWGIMPRLVWRWNKNRSNHPFYGDYSKHNVFIQLNKAF